MLSNIYEKLNQQYSLSDVVRISDVTSVEGKEWLTAKGYPVGFTAEEWQKRFPRIPADKVICPKSVLFGASLMYYDKKKAICFPLRIINGEVLSLRPMSDEETEESFLKEIAKLEAAHEQRKYTSLLLPSSSEGSGNITMQLLCDILRADEPGEDIFSAFLNFYSESDCGTGLLFAEDDILDKLLACRSDAQKAQILEDLSAFPEIITVYRGEGNKSTDYHKALSWTTDVNKSYFFASWRSQGEASRVLTAQVAKADVLAYLTDQNEGEVLALPSALRNVKETPCVTTREFIESVFGDLRWMEGTAFNELNAKELLTAVRAAYADGDEADTGDHPKAHTGRVILFASYLFRALVAADVYDASIEKKRLVARVYRQLMQSVVWHDVGRESDDIEAGHGAAGYQAYLAAGNKPDKVVEFITTYHCRPDEEAKVYHRKKLSAIKGSDMIWEAFQIMKDADALDRWRFGSLCEDFIDVGYLRFPLSRALMPVAAALQDAKLW